MSLQHKFVCKWLLMSVVMVVLMASCVGVPKLPIYLEPEFSFSAVNLIVILTPIDSRIDKAVNVNLKRQLQDKAVKMLNKKGYIASQSDISGQVGEIIEEDLMEATPEWIKSLGPEGVRWIMVICLVDLTTKLTFGSTGNAEITGSLFDKEAGTIIWRDKGIGQAGQGGLLGMAMKGLMDEEALASALGNLLRSIPKR